MRSIFLVGCMLIVGQVLSGQSIINLPDRQEMVHENRILRRTALDPVFAPAAEFPEIRATSRYLGRMDIAWDGAKVYQVGVTESRRRVVYVGSPFFTREGEKRWFWAEPKILPFNDLDDFRLLGAWQENLLFLKTKRAAQAGSASKSRTATNSQSLIRFDLITGISTSLGELHSGDDLRNTAIFSQYFFYIFTAKGKIARINVRTEPWSVDDLVVNYWTEAEVKLCAETGQLRNPFVFGMAFLDTDGSILIPAQIFLSLDREDIDLAWSKLPQIRRTELIESGNWPVPEGKEIGWKDDVCFLKFDPLTSKITQVDKARFSHLVVAEDKNFIIHRFRDVDPNTSFSTKGGKILRLDEAMASSRNSGESGSTESPVSKKAEPYVRRTAASKDQQPIRK